MASFSGNSRGGFAPRRGWGRGGRAPFFTKTRDPTKPDLKKNPLGDLIKEIQSSDLSLMPIDLAEISDCQYVASYNWLNDKQPTIVIPGMPPQWTPLHVPQRLKQDSGPYFRDPNAARYPDYPMASVVRAVLETDSEFDTAGTDVFACGSTLGNLLRFARGIDKAFRFHVEVVGETVFFIRKENDPKEVIKDIKGFGHTFPEAYTTWDHSVKGSETHQRIIRYEFGGLNCLVRFEGDGYIREASEAEDTVSLKTHVNQGGLLEAFQDAKIGQSLNTTGSKPDALKIKHGGSAVPQQSIFDLKTRSSRYQRTSDMSDIHPALWIKQISNFILAYHDGSGLFEDIRVQNVKNDVQAWARDNKDGIRRFASLLNEIVDFARSNASKLLEVYCPGADRLEIRSQYSDGVHALPVDLAEHWDNTKMGVFSAKGDSSDGFEPDEDGVDFDDGHVFDVDFDDRHVFDPDSDGSCSEPDYTACSAHDCGYCGKCQY